MWLEIWKQIPPHDLLAWSSEIYIATINLQVSINLRRIGCVLVPNFRKPILASRFVGISFDRILNTKW